MRPADDITRFIDQAAVSTNPQADKAVWEVVLTAHDKTIDKASAATRPGVRSIVMRNPITKLAVAAVLIAVIGLGIFEFVTTGGSSGVVWARVLQNTEQAPMVTFDMTAEITYSQDKKLVLPSKNYVAGEYGTRSDVLFDGRLTMIQYRLPSKKVAYKIRVDRKQYWRHDLSEQEATGDRDDPRARLKMILSGEYTKLGRATMNGATVEGIECRRPDFTGNDSTMRLWVDVETNLPVRIEVEGLGMEAGQMRPHKFVMENFEWNAPLDESLFEPNIPPDYTQM